MLADEGLDRSAQATGGARGRLGPNGKQGGLHRPCEEVPLAVLAAELAQPVSDVRLLDPLGDDLQPEVVSQVDQRGDDRGVPARVDDSRDEGTVDLQLLDRQRAQVGQ